MRAGRKKREGGIEGRNSRYIYIYIRNVILNEEFQELKQFH